MSLMKILRIEQTQDCTIGVVSVNSKTICFSLEPPKKDNRTDISCIPTGIYKIKKYKSPKFKRECLALYDVFGRDYVAIHPGNKVTQTKACILPGLRIVGQDVASSNMALDAILRCLLYEENKLEIKEL